LQYSLSRLDDEARVLLPRLSVFQGGAFETDLLRIAQIDAGAWQPCPGPDAELVR